ncbi:MAG TPA: HDOD domain-containing protein [Polyangiales bacterium]
MLAWLKSKFRGGAEEAPPPKLRPAPAVPREKPRDEALWELLRDERGPFTPLAAEDEELVIQLVLKVVDYVYNNPLDPPAMPALAPRILEVMRMPEVDVPKLVRTLEQDQAICAKLLSVANSAAFAPAREVTSLRDAIIYMGIDQAARIAIGFASKTLFDADGRAELAMYRGRWSRMFAHSMTTAFAAGTLSAQKYRRHSDEAFLGGLFHDVGKTVALRAISALTLAGEWEPQPDPILDEVLYRIHATPGAEFYDRWTLPSNLMQICCDHHQLDHVGADASNDFYVVSVISCLDALRAGGPADKRYALDELRHSAEKLKLSDAELRAAHSETHEYAKRVVKMFG